MSDLYASAVYGMAGLIFFVVVFVGIALWAYNPRRKNEIEALKNIPLDDEDSHERA